ncbi:hypothetical protein KDA_53400 [Dictyobacter alpinus]|uniref:HTH rpiR-type domain-containing protein n=1 Tax=Dictyobacter alpinus TaxID=2014873 RepID=A0A402BEY3_9CHLR|nr:alpha/beta fold hydrolase [Dictyobacter alpinus]GCE29856.1 hypothetical protein KDA_53400 [Dictyobacter alpinus]
MAILDEPLERGTLSGALARINGALTQLHPAERRVAERILNEPGQAVALSIGEFAQLCNVSQPTVSRFCRNLGFSNYATLRIGIANDLAASNADRLETLTTGTATPNFATLVTALGAIGEIPPAAYALRTASRVEIWPTPDLAHTGAVLADRLTALAVPAACSTLPMYWTSRARRLPPNAVIVVLTRGTTDGMMQTALSTARGRGARVLYCTAYSAGPIASKADWIVPLPDISPPDIAELALVEALINAVRKGCDQAIPDGPASPWVAWPYQQTVFLPNGAEPIPTILLTCEDPPQPRPVVLYFSGLHQSKESALPGTGNNYVCRCIVSALLNAGCHVLSIDARAHGGRKREWENAVAQLRKSFTGEGEDVLGAARADACALVDGVLTLGITGKAERLGVVGTSWGGLQALLTFAGDPRIACAVGVMPVTHVSQLPEFADVSDAPRVLTGQPGAWMGPCITPRPLLLIVGEKDEKADAFHAQQFIDILKPDYAAHEAAEHLHYIQIPQLDHKEHPQQITATLAWLQQFLL